MAGVVPLAREGGGRDQLWISRKALIAQPQSLGYAPLWLDSSTPEIQLPLGPVLLQLFIRGNPFRGSAGLGEKGERLLQRLLAQGQLQGLVLYGSPYLWQHLRAQLPHALPAIFSYGQMPAAQAIALDRLCAVEPAAVYNPEFTTGTAGGAVTTEGRRTQMIIR